MVRASNFAASRHLLNYLVGPQQDRLRKAEAERLSDLEIDCKLELGRLDNRHFRRRVAHENAPRVYAHQAVGVDEVWAVAHQTAGIDEIPREIDRGDRMTLRQSHQLLLLGLQERIIRDQKSTGLLIGKTAKG